MGTQPYMSKGNAGFDDIEQTLKRSAAALKEADVPFMLGGSLAVFARGGPESCADLDLIVKPDDAQRALDVLLGMGMRRHAHAFQIVDRRRHDEGDMLCVVVDVKAMSAFAMAPQPLAVIADDDNDGVLIEAGALQPGEAPIDLFIREGDLAIVKAAGPAA